MEVEIVTFVVDGSAQLTIASDRQKDSQKGSRTVALRLVIDLELGGIHLINIIFKVWIINWQYVFDVSICEVELRC